jgi:hypothetical protein
MKYLKATPAGAQFFLQPSELQLLHSLLKQFPFTDSHPAGISRTETNPQMAEREKLLKESLAEHRKDLKKSARRLLAMEKLRPWKKGHLWTVTPEEREIFLQIMNDIRVGCWYALGQPGGLDPDPGAKLGPQEFAWRSLMHMAGYFEHYLILADDPDASPGDETGESGLPAPGE